MTSAPTATWTAWSTCWPPVTATARCTHGEVLGELFARLRAGDFPAEGRLRREKGSTWLPEGAADGRLHARYLPPPAPRTKHRWWWQGMGDTHARPVETQRRVLGGLLPGTQAAPLQAAVGGAR